MKGKTGKSKMRGGGMARKGVGAAMKDGGKAKKMAEGGRASRTSRGGIFGHGRNPNVPPKPKGTPRKPGFIGGTPSPRPISSPGRPDSPVRPPKGKVKPIGLPAVRGRGMVRPKPARGIK